MRVEFSKGERASNRMLKKSAGWEALNGER